MFVDIMSSVRVDKVSPVHTDGGKGRRFGPPLWDSGVTNLSGAGYCREGKVVQDTGLIPQRP